MARMMPRASDAGYYRGRLAPTSRVRRLRLSARESPEGSCARHAAAARHRPARPRVGVLVVAYNAATTLAQTLDRLPEAFVDSVDHVLVCDDASHDDTYEVGLRFQSGSHPAADRGPARARTSATAATRRPATRWAIDARPRHRRAAARRRPVRPGGASRTSSRRWSAGEADAVFGSRMMRARRGPRGRHAALQVRRQPHPDALQNKVAGPRPERVAQRLPRLPRRRARATSTSRRTPTTSTSTPRSSWACTRREADRRGADPDLLRRRDLLRQRHDATPGRHRRRAALPGCARWASAAGRPAARTDDAYELKPSRTPRTACCCAGSSRRPPAAVLDVGCSDGQFAALARGHGPPRDRRRPGQARGRRPSGSTRFVEADLNAGLPAEAGTDYDVVVAGDVLEHVDRPRTACWATSPAGSRAGGEILVSVPNFGHWYPRAPGRARPLRLRPARSARPRPRPVLHPPQLRAARRARAGCGSSSGDTVGSPFDVLDRGGDRHPRRAPWPRGVAAPTAPRPGPGRRCSATSSSTGWSGLDRTAVAPASRSVATAVGLVVGGTAFFLTLLDFGTDPTPHRHRAAATPPTSSTSRPGPSSTATSSCPRQPGHRGLRRRRPRVHVLPARSRPCCACRCC